MCVVQVFSTTVCCVSVESTNLRLPRKYCSQTVTELWSWTSLFRHVLYTHYLNFKLFRASADILHLSCQSTFLSLLLSPLPRQNPMILLVPSHPNLSPGIIQSLTPQPEVGHLVLVHLGPSPSTRICCCSLLLCLAIRIVSFRLVTVRVEASRITSCVSIVSYRIQPLTGSLENSARPTVLHLLFFLVESAASLYLDAAIAFA